MENVLFGKILPFKSTNGKFCQLKKDDSNFTVDITGTVIKSENETVYLISNKSIIDTNENIRKQVIRFVLENSKNIYGMIKTIDNINDFYCSPIKSILIDSKYIDVLRCKSKKMFEPGSTITIKAEIMLWFGRNSFGIYYNVINNEIVLNKCLFAPESSDDEINF